MCVSGEDVKSSPNEASDVRSKVFIDRSKAFGSDIFGYPECVGERVHVCLERPGLVWRQ